MLGEIIPTPILQHSRHSVVGLVSMASIPVAARAVWLDRSLRVRVELPLPGYAVAMPDATISRSGGVSLRCIIVTNNMIQFATAVGG